MIFVFLIALVAGVVAGMRTFTAPAGVSWAAYLGRIDLAGSVMAFMSNIWTCLIFTLLALAELVFDQLPRTPSRTLPGPFAARLISGGFCGAAIGAGHEMLIAGMLGGLVGAVIGTLGGRAFRGKLAAAFGRDRPAAFIEDAVAILAIVLVGVMA